MPHLIRLGTRASALALAQTTAARDCFVRNAGMPPESFTTVRIRTTGDQIQDRALAELGGKALFVRELDRALLAEEIDIAVHAAKDLPGQLAAGVTIAGVLPRGDPADALISTTAQTIAALPMNAEIGTSSPRRQAQLRRRRSDLQFTLLRGNVETRIAKTIEGGSTRATFLAVIGIERLGMKHDFAHRVDPAGFLPAIGQGVIALTVQSDNHEMKKLVQRCTDPATADTFAAERSFLQRLGGDCHSPIAGLAVLRESMIALRGEILSPDGSECYRGVIHGPRHRAEALGNQLAEKLLHQAGTTQWVP